MELFGYTIVKTHTYHTRHDEELEKLVLNYLTPDNYENYLKHWYYVETRKILNLEYPKSFNEKIQWLKIHETNPLKTKLADKYLVKDYIKEQIGEKYVIPLLGVWDNFDDIDFSKLPQQFVLKCNHASRRNIIVRDKSKLDIDETRKTINNWLKTNYIYHGLELQYKDIPRKIIAEKYLETRNNDLMDYKFLCFNGKPIYVWIDKGRFKNHKRNLYDMDWNLQKNKLINTKYKNFGYCQKPKNFELMKQFAAKLSQDFIFVRIDFYEHNDNLYFGEFTFSPENGTTTFYPEELNYELGNLIKLPE